MTTDLEQRLADYRTDLERAIADDLDRVEPETRRHRRPDRRRVVLAVAVLVVCFTGAVGLSAVLEGSGDSPPTSAPAATEPSIDPPVAQTTVVAPVPIEPTPLEIEQRLAELGFDPGEVDGDWDERTESAIWAAETMIGGVEPAEVTGRVSPQLWESLADLDRLLPRGSHDSRRHIEIYVDDQAMVAFNDGEAVIAAHVSTGRPGVWCDTVEYDHDMNGRALGETLSAELCGQGATPGGSYRVHTVGEGELATQLGRMSDPVFFNFGIAIHGSSSAPATADGRGTVRTLPHVAAQLRSFARVGDGVTVWVDEQPPSGRQPPFFPYPKPTIMLDDGGPHHEVIALGGSVLLGAAEELVARGVVVDAAESRDFADLVPLSASLAAADRLGSAVLIDAAGNGSISASDVDLLMESLVDVPVVAIATTTASTDFAEPNNELIRELPDRFPNVVVVDWAEIAIGCADTCLYPDGFHLLPPAGPARYAVEVVEVLDLD